MNELYYENHANLLMDALCPFRAYDAEDRFEGIGNWHTNLEFFCITKGEGWIQYGAEEIAVSAGDVVVFNTDVIHNYRSNQGISYICIIIDETFCKENGIDTTAAYFEKCFKDARTFELVKSVNTVTQAYKQSKEPYDGLKARAAMLNLLVNLCECHLVENSSVATTKRISENYVKKALSYLSQNYTSQNSLDSLANMCGISKYHLVREFKLYTGQTIFNYINALRCKKASLCLVRGMSVTETAYECGFESASYFSRMYKKITKKSPSASKVQN